MRPSSSSLPFLWTWYVRSISRDLLQFRNKNPDGFKDEVITRWQSNIAVTWQNTFIKGGTRTTNMIKRWHFPSKSLKVKLELFNSVTQEHKGRLWPYIGTELDSLPWKSTECMRTSFPCSLAPLILNSWFLSLTMCLDCQECKPNLDVCPYSLTDCNVGLFVPLDKIYIKKSKHKSVCSSSWIPYKYMTIHNTDERKCKNVRNRCCCNIK